MRYHYYRHPIPIGISLAFLLSGCGAFSRMTGTMALRNSIRNKFNVQDVAVDLRENELVVMLPNSGYEDSPSEAKAGFAQKIAEFVRDNYREINTVAGIRVMLVKKNSDALIRKDYDNSARVLEFFFDQHLGVLALF